MTRELLFSTSFEPQLTAFTGWKSLVNVEAGLGSGLGRTRAPSDFPGFEIIPGEAKYIDFDGFGHPIDGTQAFTLRIYFAHPQLAVSTLRAMRSADVSILEAFFAGGYILPPVSTGDPVRIDSLELIKIDPAVLSKAITRSSIVAEARYAFTIF
ncbi:MAG TPA: hypothetical protein VGM92_02905 [Candidatus Kapabacteria bacterium]|jgi:hypothetical protein